MDHKIKIYMDGNIKVPFCERCSAEGIDLNSDCPGKVVDKSYFSFGKNGELIVDKPKEPK